MENKRSYQNLIESCRKSKGIVTNNELSAKERLESMLDTGGKIFNNIDNLSQEELNKINKAYTILETLYKYTLEKSWARDENGKTEWEEK